MLARIREIGKGDETKTDSLRGSREKEDKERRNKEGNNEGMLVEGWDENLDHISEK